MGAVIRAVIVDDEPPARRRIRALLANEHDVEVIAECRDGREALTVITAAQPDLVFLDVQMPETDGLAVARSVEKAGGELPLIVFTTAHSQFAVPAFDVDAVDYLLKPFDPDRFRAAVARARESLGTLRRGADLSASAAPTPGTYVDRVPVRMGTRICLVPVGDIDYCEAEANYVRLHAGGQSYLVRETLAGMEAKLDPSRFLRIHRSLIVQLARVESLEPLFHGDYLLRLRSGARLTSGRTYRARLHQALNLD
jgi:two-component system, LytTR family, response regulator